MKYTNISGLISMIMFFTLSAKAENYQNVELENYLISNPNNIEWINDSCKEIPDNELRSIEVYKNREKKKEKIKYWYRYSKSEQQSNSQLPTIFYIPGGPGGGSMTYYGIGYGLGLLVEQSLANVILIDPRGVNCNWLNPSNLTPKMVATAQVALDIIEIIKQEKLKDYFIYGSSYGTVVGTVLSDLISKNESVPKPKKVILEGVFGNSYDTLEFGYYNNYARIANSIISDDPRFSFLVKNLSSFPVSYPSDVWGFVLIDVIDTKIFPDSYPLEKIASEFYSSKDVSEDSLKYLEEQADLLADEDRTGSMAPSPEENYVYESVWCTELDSVVPNSKKIVLEGTTLVVKDSLYLDPCEKFQPNEEFYDSKKYQIAFPIVYINGDLDPATPISSAYYHYDTQLNSPSKTFIKVKDDGHNPTNNKLQPCFLELWSEILKTNSNFDTLLNENGQCLKTDQEIQLTEPQKL